MDKKKLTTAEIVEIAESGDFEKLSENGKYEVNEFTIGGEKLVVRADFKLLKDAYTLLINPEFKPGSDAVVKMDIIGAGDKILFYGAVLNRDKFMGNARLRMMACQELGAWVAEVVGEDVQQDEKKTSQAS